MKKKEFLRRLARGLRHLERREVDSILDYYDELIEDTMDRRGLSEEEVIEDLGPIEDIIAKVDPNLEVSDKIKYDPPRRTNKRVYYEETKTLSLLVIILLWPVWLVLGILVFTFYITLFALAIAGIWGGISNIVYGFERLNSVYGLFNIGGGIIIIGVTIAFLPLLGKLVLLLTKGVKALITAIFGSRRKVRRYAYEN